MLLVNLVLSCNQMDNTVVERDFRQILSHRCSASDVVSGLLGKLEDLGG